MPVVEKTSGGQVYIRSLGRQLELGDRESVSDDLAAYLCEERGDFEEVQATDVEFTEVDEGDGSGGQEDEPPDDEDIDVESLADEVIAERIDDGECPWCDEYEGDAVGQHAASAHPDAWDDYKED